MSYIGNQSTTSYTSMTKQDITGNGGASYTLSHAVSNANEIAVYVNNVRQEPTSAYTVNDTALNMTGNVASSDDFYVIYLGKAVQTVVPPDGSVGTAKIANSAVDLTSKVTGTLPVANGGTGLSSGFTNGISMYNLWQLTSGHDTGSSGEGIVNSTFTLKTDQGVANYGGNMTYSSGIWTFPSTGIYLVKVVLNFGGESTSPRNAVGQIRMTTDNSTYNIVSANSDSAYGHNVEGNCFVEAALNITNVSTHKFLIWMDAESRVVIRNSHSGARPSYVSVLKIG